MKIIQMTEAKAGAYSLFRDEKVVIATPVIVWGLVEYISRKEYHQSVFEDPKTEIRPFVIDSDTGHLVDATRLPLYITTVDNINVEPYYPGNGQRFLRVLTYTSKTHNLTVKSGWIEPHYRI